MSRIRNIIPLKNYCEYTGIDMICVEDLNSWKEEMNKKVCYLTNKPLYKNTEVEIYPINGILHLITSHEI